MGRDGKYGAPGRGGGGSEVRLLEREGVVSACVAAESHTALPYLFIKI